MDIHWRTNAINNSRAQLQLYVLADMLLNRTVIEPARNEVILDFVSVSSRDVAGKASVVCNLVSVDMGCPFKLNGKDNQKWGYWFLEGQTLQIICLICLRQSKRT